MQLDNTRIAVRERSPVELTDLTLHVLRAHAGPLLKAAALGIAPFLLLNYALLSWIPVLASEELVAEDYGANFRYYYDMLLLVFLQAPLALAPVTVYLGQAVFVARPPLRDILADLRASWPQLLWTQGIMRLVIPGSLVMLLIADSEEFNPGIEVGIMVLIALAAGVQRAVRPFLPEIVLLEKNPLVAAGPDAITVRRRSARLHAGGAGGGDHFSRWMTGGVVNFILVYMVFQLGLFFQGVLLNNWQYATAWMLYAAYPLALWSAAGFTATCRFLSYLDTRIRNEGWEVELLLRAEAARLRDTPTAG